MTPECPREDDVVRAVLNGGWDQASDELRTHAYNCTVCCEVANVASMLRHDHDRSRQQVQVPAAGQVWWRAAIRARLERAHASTQPMTWLHGITGACVVGLLLAVVGIAWPSVVGASSWVWAQILASAAGRPVEGVISMAVSQSVVIGLVVVTCVVLAPVVLYFALSDDR